MSLSQFRQTLLGPAKLELSRGFDNKSVYGGFDKFAQIFLEKWANEEPKLKIKTLSLKDRFAKYQSLKSEERERLLKELVILIKTDPDKTEPRKIHLSLNSPIKFIPGIGEARAKIFEKLSISTVQDAINHFPMRYLDRTNILPIKKIKVGEEITIVAKCIDVRPPKSGRRFVQALFSDSTGQIMATWFNNPFILKKLAIGEYVMLSGKVGDFGGPHLTNPDIDKYVTDEGKILPVYPSTEGLPQWLLRGMIKTAVANVSDIGQGVVPEKIKTDLGLPSLEESYRAIHKPEKIEDVKPAEKRLVLEELLQLETALLLRRAQHKSQEGQAIKDAIKTSKEFYANLPFEPTRAQQKAREQMASDMESGMPMNRLLHGDVGSGKTVVGFSICHSCLKNGHQVAWIAPTEVLASQTFRNARKLLNHKIYYLANSTSKNERAKIFEELASGCPMMIVGTHAILEDWVGFKDLSLVVVDEQHRFGVLQRAKLAKKGHCPHVLVMSATPIPRTLAMTLYGDLDVSVIDEMPSGRFPITTKVLLGSSATAYKTALAEIADGHQAYVVCPLVEESEKLQAKAATTMFEELRNTHFKNIPCGLLHGRMKSKDKDTVMQEFGEGKTKVLVSTTVIEVGVDVPNATVMIIENAERFGLAQLHQLRGRVGRGGNKSHCFLIPSRPSQALQILERTNNGLEVAEEDLKLRGPGDIGGTLQSGMPILSISKLLNPSNFALLSLARDLSEGILRDDPELQKMEHRNLKEGIMGKMAERVGLAWVS